jgi:hypothetical protein
MDENVHQLDIKPATHRFHHEGFVITVIYHPATKSWAWTASKPVQSKIEWTGQAMTASKALSEAKKRINKNA